MRGTSIGIRMRVGEFASRVVRDVLVGEMPFVETGVINFDRVASAFGPAVDDTDCLPALSLFCVVHAH